jgi:hypothetical protein
MSTLLGYLEGHLGAIDTWPTPILRKLFVEDPTLLSLTTLTSFFFGNRVDFEVAAPFCAFCIGHSHLKIIDIMADLFRGWTEDHHTRHLAVYYDMVLRCFLFVNGSACAEPREPLPIIFGHIPIPLGFAGLGGRTEEIEGKLRLAAETPTFTS